MGGFLVIVGISVVDVVVVYAVVLVDVLVDVDIAAVAVVTFMVPCRCEVRRYCVACFFPAIFHFGRENKKSRTYTLLLSRGTFGNRPQNLTTGRDLKKESPLPAGALFAE